MNLDRNLARTMLVLHPVESSRILETLRPDEAAETLSDLDPDRSAPVLRNMVRVFAAGVLGAMPPDRAAAIAGVLPIDVVGQIMRLMTDRPREVLLTALPDRLAQALRPFLSFSEGTAGVFMNPDILALPRDIRVAEARQRIPAHPEGVQDPVCVVDNDHVLTGLVPLAALFTAPSEARIESLEQPATFTLPASAGLQVILSHPGWRNAGSLPVVDEHGVLLGTLNSRRLRRLEDELGTAPHGEETAEALGDLFRTGFNALLNSVLATPRPTAPQSPGEKP